MSEIVDATSDTQGAARPGAPNRGNTPKGDCKLELSTEQPLDGVARLQVSELIAVPIPVASTDAKDWCTRRYYNIHVNKGKAVTLPDGRIQIIVASSNPVRKPAVAFSANS